MNGSNSATGSSTSGDRGVRRRSMLKLIGGSAGVSQVPSNVTASTQSTENTVDLVQVRVAVKESAPSPCHIPLPEYFIDYDKKDVYMVDNSSDKVNTLINEDSVVDAHSFESLPTTVFRGTERPDPATELSPRMSAVGVIPTTGSLAYPTVRVRRDTKDTVLVSAGGKDMVVSDGERKEIEADQRDITLPPQKREAEPQQAKLTPRVVSEFHTDLTVHKQVPDEPSV